MIKSNITKIQIIDVSISCAEHFPCSFTNAYMVCLNSVMFVQYFYCKFLTARAVFRRSDYRYGVFRNMISKPIKNWNLPKKFKNHFSISIKNSR